MRQTLKKELHNLLGKQKTDILIISAANEPGLYKFRDKIINEAELKKLQENYNRTVILTRYYASDKISNATNVTCNDEKAASDLIEYITELENAASENPIITGMKIIKDE